MGLLTEKNKETAKSMYLQGQAITYIASVTNQSFKDIKSYLTLAGVRVRGQHICKGCHLPFNSLDYKHLCELCNPNRRVKYTTKKEVSLKRRVLLAEKIAKLQGIEYVPCH